MAPPTSRLAREGGEQEPPATPEGERPASLSLLSGSRGWGRGKANGRALRTRESAERDTRRDPLAYGSLATRG